MPRRGPDGLETVIRLGCGGLFGLFLVGGVLARLSLRLREPLLLWIGIPLGVAVCAWSAYRYGDAFWEGQAYAHVFGEHTFKWVMWFLVAAFAAFVIWMWLRQRA